MTEKAKRKKSSLLQNFKKGINFIDIDDETKRQKRIKIAIAILFIFVCACFTWWLLIPGIPDGIDLAFHLSRIVGIKNGFDIGQLLVKVDPGYFNGYGYANGLFYPDIFLYIPALLVYLGMKVVTAYKILLLLCTIFTALFMYMCVKGISKSRYAAVISMIIYTLASYRVGDAYSRSDLGETLAFVFFPLVILGIYKIIYENYKQWYILTFGIAAIFLSHEISSIVVSGFTVLMFLIGLFHMRKEKKRILYFFLAGIVACLLTSYFTFPMVQQILSQQFRLTTTTLTTSNLAQSVEGLLSTLFTFKASGNAYAIGISVIILPILRFKIRKNKEKYFVFSDICLAMGIICLLAVIGWFPWTTLISLCDQLKAIQFAYRLLLPATAFLSVSSGIIAFTVFKKSGLRKIVLLIVLVLSVTIATCGIYADYSGNDAMAAPGGGGQAQHQMVGGNAPSGTKATSGSANGVKGTTGNNQPPTDNNQQSNAKGAPNNTNGADAKQAPPSNNGVTNANTASSSTTTNKPNDANSNSKISLPGNSEGNKAMGNTGAMNNSSSKSSFLEEDYTVDYSVGNGEYLPEGIDTTTLESRGDVITSNNSEIKTSFTKDGTDIEIEFSNNNKSDSYLELPLIYYLGYKATLDVNGKTVNLTVEKGTNDIVRVNLGDYTSGTIKVSYEGTTLEHISVILSIVTLILLIIYIIIRKKKIKLINKKQNKLK